MKLIWSVLCIALITAGCGSSKNSMSSGGKWQKLFDGKSTAGWHSYGKPTAGAAWKALDGSLFFDPSASKGGQGGDLVTDQEFENYHLKMEWKISKNGNSGIIFNVHENAAKYGATYQTGPEMQVLDNEGHADGKINKHRSGDLYDLIASSSEPVNPVGEWNKVEIIADHGKLDFFMNGKHIVSTTMWDENWNKMVANSKFKSMPGFGTYRKGKIALQDHGNEVWFRNIEIRVLD